MTIAPTRIQVKNTSVKMNTSRNNLNMSMGKSYQPIEKKVFDGPKLSAVSRVP